MATKKQKRAEALAKREAFLEGERRHGLETQEADRRREMTRLEKMRGADANSINMERLMLLRRTLKKD